MSGEKTSLTTPIRSPVISPSSSSSSSSSSGSSEPSVGRAATQMKIDLSPIKPLTFEEEVPETPAKNNYNVVNMSLSHTSPEKSEQDESEEVEYHTCLECNFSWAGPSQHVCTKYVDKAGEVIDEETGTPTKLQLDRLERTRKEFRLYEDAQEMRYKTLVIIFGDAAPATATVTTTTTTAATTELQSLVARSTTAFTAITNLRLIDPLYAIIWSSYMHCIAYGIVYAERPETAELDLGFNTKMSWFVKQAAKRMTGAALAFSRACITKGGRKVLVKTTLGVHATKYLFSENEQTLPVVLALRSAQKNVYCIAPGCYRQGLGRKKVAYKYFRDHAVDQPYAFFRVHDDDAFTAKLIAHGKMVDKAKSFYIDVPLAVLAEEPVLTDVCVVLGTWPDWLCRRRHTDGGTKQFAYCDSALLSANREIHERTVRFETVMHSDTSPTGTRKVSYEETDYFVNSLRDVFQYASRITDAAGPYYSFDCKSFMYPERAPDSNVVANFVHELYAQFLRANSVSITQDGDVGAAVTKPCSLMNRATYKANKSSVHALVSMCIRAVDLVFMLYKYNLLDKKRASRVAYVLSVLDDGVTWCVKKRFASLSAAEFYAIYDNPMLRRALSPVLGWWFSTHWSLMDKPYCSNCLSMLKLNLFCCKKCAKPANSFCCLECFTLHLSTVHPDEYLAMSGIDASPTEIIASMSQFLDTVGTSACTACDVSFGDLFSRCMQLS